MDTFWFWFVRPFGEFLGTVALVVILLVVVVLVILAVLAVNQWRTVNGWGWSGRDLYRKLLAYPDQTSHSETQLVSKFGTSYIYGYENRNHDKTVARSALKRLTKQGYYNYDAETRLYTRTGKSHVR